MARRWFPHRDTRIGRLAASPRVRTVGAALLMLVVVVVAIGALRQILSGLSWADIRGELARIPPGRIALSVGLTVASYIVLTGYDVVSLRIIRRPVPYRTAALASFTSYIFSHNFGFAVLTGGAARLRIYRRHGLTLGEVAQIMAMTGVTFWMGVLLLLGIGFVTVPGALAIGGWGIGHGYQAGIGVLILAALAGYVAILHRRAGQALTLFGWTLVLPSPRIAAVQFLLAAVDLTLATAALFVLVPGLSIAVFPVMLVGYLLAFLSGLLAHAPGGVGVFEAVMLLALPDVDRSALFAALLLFRLIYYLIPLAIGILVFAAHELHCRCHPRDVAADEPTTPAVAMIRTTA